MRALRLVLLAGLVLTLVTACGGGGPAGVAKQWVQASAGADGATALKLTCREYREQVQMGGFMTAALGLLVGIDTEGAKADLSDLKFSTTSQSGDTATVHVSGEIIVSLLGAAMPQEFDTNLRMVKEDGAWRVCGEE